MSVGNSKVSQLLPLLRPVNLGALAVNHFVDSEAFAIFVNASTVSDLAQAWADPRGRDENAKLCREIVRCTADIKANLTQLARNRASARQRQKLLAIVEKDYLKMRESITKLGEKRFPGLGMALPQLL